MRNFIFTLFLAVLITGVLTGIIASIIGVTKSSTEKEVINIVQLAVEYAYMEGQKDFMEGDIRIQKIGEDYQWTTSPYDEGDTPLYSTHSAYTKAMEAKVNK